VIQNAGSYLTLRLNAGLALIAHADHQQKRQVSLEVSGKEVRINGRLIRIAFTSMDEGYQFLEDPEAALSLLRNSGALD